VNRDFDERLKDIKAGTGQPLTASQWRSKLRGSSGSRRINGFIEDTFNAFVDANLRV
jgi:hypothetical protein